jgi:hypothetical protein
MILDVAIEETERTPGLGASGHLPRLRGRLFWSAPRLALVVRLHQLGL